MAKKKLNYLLKKEDKGLRTYNMVHVDVLDKFGNSCKPGEIGRVVANSPCTMLYYKIIRKLLINSLLKIV